MEEAARGRQPGNSGNESGFKAPKGESGCSVALQQIRSRSQILHLQKAAQTWTPCRCTSVAGHEDRLERDLQRISKEGSQATEASAAAVQELERRFTNSESTQMRLEKRVAELSGMCTAISEEVQTQIRHGETLESRLSESRCQFEEEMRARCVEFETDLQKAVSSSRASTSKLEEDVHKQGLRQLSMESLFEGKLRRLSMDITQGLTSPESSPGTQAVVGRDTEEDDVREMLLLVQKRMETTVGLVDRMVQESSDLQLRIGAQEKRISAIHTSLDSKRSSKAPSLSRPVCDLADDAEAQLEQEHALTARVDNMRAKVRELKAGSQGRSRIQDLVERYDEMDRRMAARIDCVCSDMQSLKVAHVEAKASDVQAPEGVVPSRRIDSLVAQVNELASKVSHQELIEARVEAICSDIRALKDCAPSSPYQARAA